MLERQKYYTGVGSRQTPPNVLTDMYRLARALAPEFTLRSGAAEGADAAFEAGAQDARGPCEIFLPWKGFNDHASQLHHVDEDALATAKSVHPAWDRLAQGPRKLHARNAWQVLGRTLDDPADFLVCWTADGCESVSERRATTGGTATAVVLAERNRIPVYNLQRDTARERLAEFLNAEHSLDVSWLIRQKEQLDLF